MHRCFLLASPLSPLPLAFSDKSNGLVRTEGTLLLEGLAAVFVIALVRLLTRMRPHVLIEGLLCREAFTACFTFVRFV